MLRRSMLLCAAVIGCAMLLSSGAWAHHGGGHAGFGFSSLPSPHKFPPLRRLPPPRPH